MIIESECVLSDIGIISKPKSKPTNNGYISDSLFILKLNINGIIKIEKAKNIKFICIIPNSVVVIE